jgi:hypothetical protein
MVDGSDGGLYRRLANVEKGFNERLQKAVTGR